ncbi:hypothetical protein CMI37_23995 [Candidatus Pacearchaeota archaeon]|nr:hypothetical protein [Candidatus Pacearchaeota archaeon]|tara:strand:- start:536 stop:1204 length:669 start_codon:yes stop_codon:yes gene_type:complete
MAIHKVDGVDGVNHFPKKFVTLYASEAITAGDWVGIDLSDTTNGLGGSVRPLDFDDGLSGTTLPLGVAIQTVATDLSVMVQTAGKYENSNVAATVAAGDKLYATTVTGRAADQAAALADVQIAIVAGDAATTDIAVAGSQTQDDIIFVAHISTTASVATIVDITSEASFTTDGQMQLSTTGTGSDSLMVFWQRQATCVGVALEAASGAGATTDVMIVNQGFF